MKYVKKSNTPQDIMYEIASIPEATASTINKHHLEVVNTSTGSKTNYPGVVTTNTGVANTSGTHYKFEVAFPNEGAYVVSLIGSDVIDLDTKSVLTTITVDTVYAVTLSGTYSAGSGLISF